MTGFFERLASLFRSGDGRRSDIPSPGGGVRAGGSNAFAANHNTAALALYRQVGEQAGNVFLSPFSVLTALAMTYAGARGETADQMKKALCFGTPEEDLHPSFGEILQRLRAAGGGQYELSLANALWAQQGGELLTSFPELVEQHYAGRIEFVDFKSDAEAVRNEINSWVEEVTQQKIKNLISQLTFRTRLVLVNAVSFKGQWGEPFSEEATEDLPFYREGGQEETVPLMYQQTRVRYMQGDGYQAVDLDYEGGDLSMLVLLPDERDGLGELESKVSASLLEACTQRMSWTKVDVYLPRFSLTWGSVDLADPLRALGMPLPLSLEADFSGINGLTPPNDEALSISSVFHKAFVEVNEEGTEAAAATAVVMVMGRSARSAPPEPTPVFRADHPFLFAIRDKASGVLVFLGRMTEPS